MHKSSLPSSRECSPRGILCFPQQTYGISKDSPDYFRGTRTLSPDFNYSYLHDANKNFAYESQRNTFYINKEDKQPQTNWQSLTLSANPNAFHLKKGLLSQFVDKNRHMTKVVPLLGYERDARARVTSNLERSKRVTQRQFDVTSKRGTFLTPRQTRTIVVERQTNNLFTDKVRIRLRRNSAAQAFDACITRSMRPPKSEAESTFIKAAMTGQSWHTARHSADISQSSKTPRPSTQLRFRGENPEFRQVVSK